MRGRERGGVVGGEGVQRHRRPRAGSSARSTLFAPLYARVYRVFRSPRPTSGGAWAYLGAAPSGTAATLAADSLGGGGAVVPSDGQVQKRQS
jgi:hypothetical protein